MPLYSPRWYDWQARDCEELKFDIPFAVKEYLQNTVGQILTALQVRIWRDWDREDLSAKSPEFTENRKSELVSKEPYLFAGDQGKALAKSKVCQPLYILKKTISRSDIKGDLQDHDLRAVIILWRLKGATGLTVYNNYLDRRTSFGHFVYDGASINKHSEWAVGVKGKGFILATSFLAAKCDAWLQEQGNANEACKDLLGISKTHVGVGFNVGSRLCRTQYSGQSPNVLRVKREDFRPLTLEEFIKENPEGKLKEESIDKNGHTNLDEVYSDEGEEGGNDVRPFTATGLDTHRPQDDKGLLARLQKTYEKRVKLNLARALSEHPSPAGPSDEEPIVREDDVCIHVVGLPKELTASIVFSAVYGVVNECQSWHIPNTEFEILRAPDVFYYRDQLVPVESPLPGLGVNYHGELHLSSDRREISRRHSLFARYETNLGRALDVAISTIPEVAVLIMESVMKVDHPQFRIKPQSKTYGHAYQLAFVEACRRSKPELFVNDTTIFPFAQKSKDEAKIRPFGLLPWPLRDWQVDLLEQAGAYPSIADYSKKIFLESEVVPEPELPGLDIIKRCVSRLLPGVDIDISVRRYPYPKPRSLCIDQLIVLAQPKVCSKCAKASCLCWVGPSLIRAVQSYMAVHKPDLEPDFESLFQEYDAERGLDKAVNSPAMSNTESRSDGLTLPERNQGFGGSESSFSEYATAMPSTPGDDHSNTFFCPGGLVANENTFQINHQSSTADHGRAEWHKVVSDISDTLKTAIGLLHTLIDVYGVPTPCSTVEDSTRIKTEPGDKEEGGRKRKRIA